MWNPVTRLKAIVGELLHNSRRSLQFAEAQTTLVSPLDIRLGALETRLGALESHIGTLKEGLRALEATVLGIAALRDPRNEAADPGMALLAAYRRLGILNWENDTISGERHFLSAFLAWRPDALVLDVGANEGQFSTLLRDLSPRPVIHAFEPHPGSFAALSSRAQALDITVHRLALGASSGEVTVFDYVDEQGSQHASLYRDVIEKVHRRPAAALTSPCRTLDSVAEEFGLGTIGLLKIDTEGHEYAVLQGAQGLLAAGAIEVIELEFNEMNTVSRVFLRDFMELLPGYRFLRLLPRGAVPLDSYDPRVMEIFAYQNIVCVRRDLDSDWVLRS